MNIFNEDFITDSYLFLESIKYFKDDNEQMFNNKYLRQYKNELIFLQIKELHDKIGRRKVKQDKSKQLLGTHLLAKIVNTDKKGNNMYTNLLEDFLNQRMEEEKRQKEIEKEYNHLLDYYNTEQLTEVLRVIYSNTIQKEKLFRNKDEKVIMFEESVMNYLGQELAAGSGFTDCSNKNFTMSYKVTKDNSITLKFEKELDVNFINFLSLVYETACYPKWFPFMVHSELSHQPGKAKKVVYMQSNIPIISNRDFLIYGFGVNKIKENRTLLVCVKSIEEHTGVFEECFNKKKNSKFVRALIHIFGYEIKIINKNKIYLRGLLNTDPKISFFPQGLINTFAKKFAEDLFAKMLKITKSYEGSEYQNKNPSEMDKQFYDFINTEATKLADY
jgi:hypothetical protein